MKIVSFTQLLLGLSICGCSQSDFSSSAPNGKKKPSSSQQEKDKTPEQAANDDSILSGDSGTIDGESGCKSIMKLGLPGVAKFLPNIVPEGDFEGKHTPIVSDYMFDSLAGCVDSNSLVPGIGRYSIVVNPRKCHRAWDELQGPSKIAIFNGAVGNKFWCKKFPVEAGKSYAFSVEERLLHVAGAANSKNAASPLRWTISGTDIVGPLSPVQEWRTRGAVWNANSSTEVEICGRNDNTNNSGNDWAIDNICLVPQ
ncbi:MAG: hypothetical protein NT027_07020 [Proteobacteria bacterium]|nr:hypothetical protein [Pseudomonadota bacterium]